MRWLVVYIIYVIKRSATLSYNILILLTLWNPQKFQAPQLSGGKRRQAQLREAHCCPHSVLPKLKLKFLLVRIHWKGFAGAVIKTYSYVNSKVAGRL